MKRKTAMHATLPLLKPTISIFQAKTAVEQTSFPPLHRGRLTTLQINLGYRCNQTCLHCHVNAGPSRTEMMSLATIEDVLALMRAQRVSTIDVTGGAPEMNEHFRYLVTEARAAGVTVIDRCNLTILFEPGQDDLAEFLAAQQVQIVASLPCYLEDNVNKQRGDGVYEKSIAALQRLNALGYGKPDTGLSLNLVFNPQGPSLPPNQVKLEADYEKHLREHYDIEFNQLFTIANMPISRFGSTLVSKGQFNSYMQLLMSAHRDENVESVMCRSLISIDYQGDVYDCDFNQMLGLPLQHDNKPKTNIRDLLKVDLTGKPIVIADHCYGCTAGQGSSCSGALV
jgi:radical SAM/Cys-rich protein